MTTKKENPVLLLLKWAEKDRGFLIASVICAFLGGLLAIGPYIGIYRLMDAFLTDTCSIQVISENAVLITATVIIRQVFQGLSGIFLIKALMEPYSSAVYDYRTFIKSTAWSFG